MKNPQPIRYAIIAAALIGLLPAGPTKAATLEVSPILIDAPAGQSTTTLRVTNRGASGATIQVRGFQWSQTSAGDDLAPTDELLASPPIFTLPTGETQVIRLLFRPRAGQDQERAFRLLIDEIAEARPGAVNMALRISVPAFVAAQANAAPELRWRAEQQGGGSYLVLTNAGRKRTRISALAVAGPGGQPVALKLLGANPYALPGGERRWALGTRSLPGATLRLSGKADSGPIDVALQTGR